MAVNRLSPVSLELKIYPLLDHFVCNISLPDYRKITRHVPMIIILDRSPSMGFYVAKVVNRVLPKFFANLRYDGADSFGLITFDSETVYSVIEISTLSTNRISYNGMSTLMSPAVKTAHEVFEAFARSNVDAVRVLTISDGEIHDMDETKANGDLLANFASQYNIAINSQAVRFFTSSEQPDTTAICSLLQLNNVLESNLMDINADEDDEVIAEKMSNLFINDGLDKIKILKNSQPIFYRYPWDAKAFDELLIFPGKNCCWLREIPKTELKVDESIVRVKIEANLRRKIFEDEFGEKLNFIHDQIKILQIIDTKYAERKMQCIGSYFNATDECLEKNSIEESKVVASQAKLSQLDRLKATVKDDEVSKMDNEHKAEYLRNKEDTPNLVLLASILNHASYEFKVTVMAQNSTKISQSNYEAFNYRLGVEMDKINERIHFMPNFLNNSYESGCITYECQGRHSVEFLTKVAKMCSFQTIPEPINPKRSSLAKPSTEYSSPSRPPRRSKRVVFKIFTHEKNVQSEIFLRRVKLQNQGAAIDTSAWRILNVTSSERGTILNVEMDEASALIVRRVKWLFYWVSIIKFVESGIPDIEESFSPEKMRHVGNAELCAKKAARKYQH